MPLSSVQLLAFLVTDADASYLGLQTLDNLRDLRLLPPCSWGLHSSELFTQLLLVVVYRRFGVILRFHL